MLDIAQYLMQYWDYNFSSAEVNTMLVLRREYFVNTPKMPQNVQKHNTIYIGPFCTAS